MLYPHLVMVSGTDAVSSPPRSCHNLSSTCFIDLLLFNSTPYQPTNQQTNKNNYQVTNSYLVFYCCEETSWLQLLWNKAFNWGWLTIQRHSPLSWWEAPRHTGRHIKCWRRGWEFYIKSCRQQEERQRHWVWLELLKPQSSPPSSKIYFL